MTDQVVKFVSKVKISCPKLQNHIECTWVITFWFSCIWQVEPTIRWCFDWLKNQENLKNLNFNTYFGAFFQSPQRTSQYWHIQKKHILVVKYSPGTMFQSSFTCSFNWWFSFLTTITKSFRHSQKCYVSQSLTKKRVTKKIISSCWKRPEKMP